MANWSGLMLTRKGELLHAKVEINLCKLHLTKIKLGSGVLEDGQQLETLTDLIRPQQTVGIGSVTDNKDGTVTIEGIITNADLETGYTVTEMGLFATDPDKGEILYAITRDAHPDYLPAKGGATIVAQEFNLSIGITNAANVTATIHMGSLATIEHIQKIIKMLQEHNTAPDAHENRFAALMAELGGYLPLTGGAMSGAITVGNCPGMRKATDREETYVYGGTTNKDGAAFGLRGVNCTEYGEELRGSFGIAAVHPSGAVHMLNGLGNGDLLWDGINIGAGGIVAQSIGQNGYIKLGNGLIIQWGYAEQKDSSPLLIAFPIVFPSLPLSLVFGEDAATNNMLETAQYVNLTNHGFTFYGSNMTLGNLVPGPCKAFWLALGY